MPLESYTVGTYTFRFKRIYVQDIPVDVLDSYDPKIIWTPEV